MYSIKIVLTIEYKINNKMIFDMNSIAIIIWQFSNGFFSILFAEKSRKCLNLSHIISEIKNDWISHTDYVFFG